MKEIVKKSCLKNHEYRFISKIFSDEIYLVFLDDNYIAISGFCPHYGGPLKINKNNEFHCYWHDWKFDVNNLSCKNYSYKNKLKKYNVIEKGDLLEISL